MTEPLWATRDGRYLPVCDMTVGHLRNAARWATTHAENCYDLAAHALSYASSAPDGAAYAAEGEANSLRDEAVNLSLWSDLFTKELERRKEPVDGRT